MNDVTTTSDLATRTDLAFPAGFRWGVATAAFQIEGATHADGRTDSIWDAFCRVPGAVANGDTGEPACDHYRRMPDDVALMAGLGVDTYRFSVAWPRVHPDGGRVNPAGVDFYQRLVETLLEHGIRPWATLYHWDLPQALEDAGGWTNRDTASRFADYAQTVHDALGDRVPTWTTLNEPFCSAFLGYAAGVHAPGRREPLAAVAAAHHLLLAHGLGAQVLREGGAEHVGITLNLAPFSAADPDDPADTDVVRRLDGLHNRIFLDPVLRGEYPSDVADDLAPFGLDRHVGDGDLALIGAPIDVLGINYYSTTHVEAKAPTPGEEGREAIPWAVGVETVRSVSRGLPRTAMGWEIEPDGLRRILVRLHDEYPATPLVITENGSAWDDTVGPDGAIDDHERVAYLRAHLAAAHAAIEAGVDLQGYLAWSLLDNFEWAYGYGKRFGIVRVDYDTQVRTPKSSARVFADIARSNAL
ncbi:MAG: GH1 family beta-glucosidase [Ilumatobacteraceae bacterium]